MNKFLKKLSRFDAFLVLPVLTFLALTLPSISTIPYLDGNIDFVKSYDFHSGGMKQLLSNWNSVHPPVKEFLSTFSWTESAPSIFSYTVVGLVFGLIGIFSIYFLAKNLINKNAGRFAAILLSINPLFLSVGLFSLTDFLVCNLLLLTLLLYYKKQIILYSISASLLVLIKETALLLPITIIIIEIFYYFAYRFKNKDFKYPSLKSILFTLPVIAFLLWMKYLESQGKGSWGDWNFSATAEKGTFYTIAYNLVSFNFVNKYAIQNWSQIFTLNFNWIYWLICSFGILIRLISLKDKDKKEIVKLIKEGNAKWKTIIVLSLFTLFYIFAVLSFQTYTIPRYGLPLIPIMILGFSYSCVYLWQKSHFSKLIFVLLLPPICYLALFTSSDPVSAKLWGETKILDRKFYALNSTLAGNDGITYNYQYISLAKERSELIKFSNAFKKPIESKDCHWIFPDPNNDQKTLEYLELYGLPTINRCMPPTDF